MNIEINISSSRVQAIKCIFSNMYLFNNTTVIIMFISIIIYMVAFLDIQVICLPCSIFSNFLNVWLLHIYPYTTKILVFFYNPE